jgi:hypothetical protein
MMRRLSQFLLALVMVLVTTMSADDLTAPYAGRSPWVEAGGDIMSRVSTKLFERYGLQVTGSGGCLMHNIESLTLSFTVTGMHTVGQARELIVDCVRVFLHEMNSDLAARPYLAHYPADVMDISVMIAFRDRSGKPLFVPDLRMVSVSRGIVVYRSVDKENPLRYIEKYSESFEEAKEKVQWTES